MPAFSRLPVLLVVGLVLVGVPTAPAQDVGTRCDPLFALNLAVRDGGGRKPPGNTWSTCEIPLNQ